MDIKCEVCESTLDAVFCLNTPKGKPAFLSERKYPRGFRVYVPRASGAIIDRYAVASVEKHEFGWLHYLKDI